MNHFSSNGLSPRTVMVAASLLFLLSLLPVSGLQAQGTKKGTRHMPAPVPKDQGPIYEYAEQMPEFPGSVSEYLAKQVKYPPEARNNDQQGRVIIRFVVERNGKVNMAEVAKSSAVPALDQEALRVVRAMPPWKPGRHQGALVRVYFYLPVKFLLD